MVATTNLQYMNDMSVLNTAHLFGGTLLSYLFIFFSSVNLGLYYAVVMTLVSLATAMSVVTLNIHHRGIHGSEVPPAVKKFVFGVLAKILFIQVDYSDTFDTTSSVSKNNAYINFILS